MEIIMKWQCSTYANHQWEQPSSDDNTPPKLAIHEKPPFNDDNAPPKLAKSHIRLRTPLVAKVTTLLSNIALLQQEDTQFIPVFSTTGCTPYFSAFPSIFVWEYNVVDLLEARKTRGVWQAAIYRNELSSTQQFSGPTLQLKHSSALKSYHSISNNASCMHDCIHAVHYAV